MSAARISNHPPTQSSPAEISCDDSCCDKCQLVAAAVLFLAGVVTMACGIIFTAKAALITGIVLSAASLAYGIFFGCCGEGSLSQSSDNENAGDPPSFSLRKFRDDPSYKRRCIRSAKFWNQATQKDIQGIVPYIDSVDFSMGVPLHEIDFQKQMTIFRAFKGHPEEEALKRHFTKNNLSSELLEEMSEKEINRYYGQSVILCFISENYSFEKQFNIKWSDLEAHHEKILRAIILTSDDRALDNFVSRFFKNPQQIKLNGREATVSTFYQFLKRMNFNFNAFFESPHVPHDSFELHELFLKDIKGNKKANQREHSLQLLFKGSNARFLCHLLNNPLLRKEYKPLMDEMVRAVSNDSLDYLKLDTLVPEAQIILFESLKKDPEKAKRYLEYRFSLVLLKHFSEKELATYYGKQFMNLFSGAAYHNVDRNAKIGEYTWWDLKPYHDKILRSIRNYGLPERDKLIQFNLNVMAFGGA